MMAEAMILSPIGLIICILIPWAAIFLAHRPQLSAVRLIGGYLGGLCTLAIAVAAYSYVSPQEAVSVWHVPPENYWSALFELLLSTFVVAAFVSLVGISVVGIPVLVRLSNRGMATAPWLILSSVAISTAFAIVVYVLRHSASDATFFDVLWFLVVSHVIVAAGFALAARLPWAFRSNR
jgi:hypothetical protein